MNNLKLFISILINILVINVVYCKVATLGLAQKRNSIVGSLKPLTKESFRDLIKNTKEAKEANPKYQLASILKVSPESTVKGIPIYTSQREEEVYEQIESSQILMSSCIKLAHNEKLIKVFSDSIRNFFIGNWVSSIFDELRKIYPEEEFLFITFARDLKEEQMNLEKQIDVLNQLENFEEVKENKHLKNLLNQTLDFLVKLKGNVCSLIKLVDDLIINTLEMCLYLSEDGINLMQIDPNFAGAKVVFNEQENSIDDIGFDYILTRSFPELTDVNLEPFVQIELADEYYFFRPSYA